jgi:hypothetical protein
MAQNAIELEKISVVFFQDLLVRRTEENEQNP